MPNAKVLESKKAVVEALSAKIKESTSIVFVDYKGINVAQDTALRKLLRAEGVTYKVYKNTMTERACNEAGYPGMKEYLTGMTALAVSGEDAIAPAKILKEYAEKIPSFQILAGYVDGEVIDEVSDRFGIRRFYFDNEKGNIQSYTEKFRISLETIYGNNYVFQGTAGAEIGELKRVNTVDTIEKVQKEIEELEAENKRIL